MLDGLAATAARLVAIPSVTGSETEIAHHLIERLGERPVQRVGNAIICPPPDDGRPVLTLVGHTDTVPPAGNARPREEGDRLFGLGATDMKGGLAVMLELAEAMPADAPVALALVFYPGEEGPLRDNGLRPVLEGGHFPRTDLAVVLEPTDGTIQLGCLGVVNGEAVFRGEAAHSARPWLGRNAIHAAAGLLAALGDRAPRKVLVGQKLVYREVVSATTARGGTARNVIPSEFRVNLNFRFAPNRTVDDAVAWLTSFVKGQAGELEVVDAAPPGPVCEGNALLAALEGQGLDVEPKQAWTDVAQLGEYGIDAVNYGPGETALAHTAHESVSIAALERCYDTLWRVITAAEADQPPH